MSLSDNPTAAALAALVLSLAACDDSDPGTPASGAAGYLTSESDPKVGMLQTDRWCRSDGSKIVCDAESPPRPVRTVLVSPVPGDDLASGDVLLAAMASIIDAADPDNRYLLRLEPGRYDLGTESLQLKDGVTVVGAGPLATQIVSANPRAATVLGGEFASELRQLGIRHRGTVASAVALDQVSPEGALYLKDTRVIAFDGTTETVALVARGKVSMHEVLLVGHSGAGHAEGGRCLGCHSVDVSDVVVSAAEADATIGVYAGDGANLDLRRTIIEARGTISAGVECRGARFSGRDVSLTASGTQTSRGLDCPGDFVTLDNANLGVSSDADAAGIEGKSIVMNSTRVRVSGYSKIVGLRADAQTAGETVWLTMRASGLTTWTYGDAGENSYGIEVKGDVAAGHDAYVKVESSTIYGNWYGIWGNERAHLSLASSQLSGGIHGAPASATCFAVYDRNFQNSNGLTACP